MHGRNNVVIVRWKSPVACFQNNFCLGMIYPNAFYFVFCTFHSFLNLLDFWVGWWHWNSSDLYLLKSRVYQCINEKICYFLFGESSDQNEREMEKEGVFVFVKYTYRESQLSEWYKVAMFLRGHMAVMTYESNLFYGKIEIICWLESVGTTVLLLGHFKYFEYDMMGTTNSGIFRRANRPWPFLAKKNQFWP